jgi:hypothetical protein
LGGSGGFVTAVDRDMGNGVFRFRRLVPPSCRQSRKPAPERN